MRSSSCSTDNRENRTRKSANSSSGRSTNDCSREGGKTDHLVQPGRNLLAASCQGADDDGQQHLQRLADGGRLARKIAVVAPSASVCPHGGGVSRPARLWGKHIRHEFVTRSTLSAPRHNSSRGAGRHSLPQPPLPRAAALRLAIGCRRNDMSQTRRLAAILAADIAGYSRLIGADEGRTLRRLKALPLDWSEQHRLLAG